MVIKQYKTTVSVRFPGAVSLYLEANVGYVVDTSIRYKPRVDQIQSIQFKINGQFQGVEELTVALRDAGCYSELMEEIQQQETEDAEFGEAPAGCV